jgi:hypothetical protein
MHARADADYHGAVTMSRLAPVMTAATLVSLTVGSLDSQQLPRDQRILRSGVEIVTVTATVLDPEGRLGARPLARHSRSTRTAIARRLPSSQTSACRSAWGAPRRQ